MLMKFGFFLLIVAIWSNAAWAVGVTAELDHTIIELGDQVQLVVRVEGDLDGDVAPPEIKGVDTQFIGPQTQLSIINGRTSRSTSLVYSLIPQTEGSFVVPEIRARIEGRDYATVPLKFKVLGAGKMRANGDTPPVFIERSLSKSTLWVGEPVVAKIRLHHRVPLQRPQVDPATPANVRRLQIKGQKESQTLVDGARYNVIEISEVLIALKPGEIELPPYKITALIPAAGSPNQGRRTRRPFDMFDDFFSDPFARGRMRQRSFSSGVGAISVKKLPPAPADYSGLVGRYSFSASLNQNTVKAGDTLTLSLALNGRGNLEGAQIFEDLSISGVKIYPDKPEIVVGTNANEGLVSRAVFKFALVPNVTGSVDLGGLNLIVFNPELGQYETLRAELGEVKVTGVARTPLSKDVNDQKRRVRKLNDDLLGVHMGAKLLEDQKLRLSYVLFSTGLCGLPVFVGLFGWWRRRFLFNQHFLREKRKSKAFGMAKAKIQSASTDDPELGLKTAIMGIREYFAMKFNLKGEALTTKDFAKILNERGLDSVDTKLIEKLFELYSQVEYGQPDLTPLQESGWRDEVVTALARIDREVK